jgi:HPt (histidine-containing phosphotransfer) domain-containing protein
MYTDSAEISLEMQRTPDMEVVLEQEMRLVGQAFLQRTKCELVRVHELIDAIGRDEHDSEQELFGATHRIRGTAALLGFGALSRRVEELEAAVLDAVTSPHDDAADSIHRTQRVLLKVEGELSRSFGQRIDRRTVPLLSMLCL